MENRKEKFVVIQKNRRIPVSIPAGSACMTVTSMVMRENG
jgi:hypothetical protein